MGKYVSVLDVAASILKQHGAMSTWKLQKLCYYSQAWSLVWDEEPLFSEDIQAWAHGPVIPKLYDRHKGHFNISTIRGGDHAKLNKDQQETVNVMLSMYGGMSGVALSRLTHQELPWREARQRAGLKLGERGSAKIDLDRMAEFYSSLYIEDGEETEEQE